MADKTCKTCKHNNEVTIDGKLREECKFISDDLPLGDNCRWGEKWEEIETLSEEEHNPGQDGAKIGGAK